MKDKLKKYRIFLYHILLFSILLILSLAYQQCCRQIPDSILIKSGTSQEINWNLPVTGAIEANTGSVVSFQKPVTIIAGKSQEKYRIDLKLFGIVPLKKLDVEVIENRELIPMGYSMGIYIKTQGVLVLSTGVFKNRYGDKVNPARNLLKAGDYILTMDGATVENKNQIKEYVENCEGRQIRFQVQREKRIQEVSILPEQVENNTYKMGVWLRDSAQGIGTLTYVDEQQGFGALGHGIKDIDVGELMSLGKGFLYDSEILDIKKGQKGMPGEMTGLILYEEDQICGLITKNTNIGIYGVGSDGLIQKEHSKALPIALKQEVEVGDAYILCQLEDTAPKLYKIQITDLNINYPQINQQIGVKIVDPDLLAATGGIIQGMSGSPIIQNGKIVGAVTHVFVNDPTKGYGIFIEEMLAEQK